MHVRVDDDHLFIIPYVSSDCYRHQNTLISKHLQYKGVTTDMSKEEPKRYSIRIPQEVYIKLVDEAGERRKKPLLKRSDLNLSY